MQRNRNDQIRLPVKLNDEARDFDPAPFRPGVFATILQPVNHLADRAVEDICASTDGQIKAPVSATRADFQSSMQIATATTACVVEQQPCHLLIADGTHPVPAHTAASADWRQHCPNKGINNRFCNPVVSDSGQDTNVWLFSEGSGSVASDVPRDHRASHRCSAI